MSAALSAVLLFLYSNKASSIVFDTRGGIYHQQKTNVQEWAPTQVRRRGWISLVASVRHKKVG